MFLDEWEKKTSRGSRFRASAAIEVEKHVDLERRFIAK